MGEKPGNYIKASVTKRVSDPTNLKQGQCESRPVPVWSLELSLVFPKQPVDNSDNSGSEKLCSECKKILFYSLLLINWLDLVKLNTFF
uniref:Uncharacterized protein n=1 Tax=Candidozyma auris TaxID=498019 RepID=A0A0L0P4H5_CANAR